MKKRYIAMTLGLMLAVSGAAVHATEPETAVESTSEITAEEAVSTETSEVLGKVKEITDDTITIETGKMKEMGPGGRGREGGAPEKPAGSHGNGEAGEGAVPEMNGETGEGSGAPEVLGGIVEDGEAPEMPGGAGDGSGAPAMPGGTGADGEVPEMPGSAGDGSGAPEMPGGTGANGEVPEMPGSADDGSGAPAMPGGSDGNGGAPAMPGGSDGNGGAPAMPGGTGGNGEAPGMPGSSGDAQGMPAAPDAASMIELSGEELTCDLADAEVEEGIAEGDFVRIVLDEEGNAVSVNIFKPEMGGPGSMAGGPGAGGPGAGGMMGGPGGGAGAPESYAAVHTYTEDAEISGETISSTGTDENAVLVEGGADVSLSDVTIDRTSSDSTGGDSASFYGTGAAILATDGTVTVSDSRITTDSAGGAGAFAYGDGTVNISDTTIHTTQGTSGGIHAAGGGTLNATNCTVTTEGNSAAAIRSDRGGGTMVINGGSYTSNGNGSPAVYCTADITINDARLEATGSEAVCIEGLNTLRLTDCQLSGDMKDDAQNDCTWTVIVYQSMSGDSELGNGTFEMTGGTLTSGNGGLFYTTNTECTIRLEDVEIIPSETNAFFLRCTGNNNARGWGQVGANGSDCLFTAVSQEMTGDIVWDSISQLDLYMTEGSTLTGAVLQDESCAGNGGDGYCSLVIDSDSTWIVTGDSTLTTLSCEGSIVDEDGQTVTVVGTDGTEYVHGDSAWTVTVGSYC